VQKKVLDAQTDQRIYSNLLCVVLSDVPYMNLLNVFSEMEKERQDVISKA